MRNLSHFSRPLVALVVLLGTCFNTAVWAQNDAYKNDPGFFDFGRVPGISGEPKVEIDLNPLMLNMVAEAANEKDPKVADILSGLRGIKLYVYEDVGNGRDQILGFIDEVSGQLEKVDWMRLVYINSEDTKVRIHVRPGTQGISGLTLMVMSDDDEAVFMNIVGDINPAKLGRLAANGGIGDLLEGLGDAMDNISIEHDKDSDS